MRRYIDADKFKSDIKDVAEITCGSFTEFEVLGILSGQPTADVRENVKANLVIAGYKRDGSTQWFECSVCGGSIDFTDNFCKHCGAQMRGGNDD